MFLRDDVTFLHTILVHPSIAWAIQVFLVATVKLH